MAAWALLLGMLLGMAGGCASSPRASRPPPPGWAHLRSPGPVAALLEHGGTVWAGGRDGLWTVSPATLGSRRVPLEVREVRALAPGTGGGLWVGHEGGVTFLGEGRARAVGGLPDPEVLCLQVDRRGRLWAGTPAGAALLDPGRGRFTPEPALREVSVGTLYEDPEGRLWAGGRAGEIRVLDGGAWRVVEVPLPEAHVNAFCTDGAGGVWVATGHCFAGGACRLAPGPGGWGVAEGIGRDDGLAGEKVRSLHRDHRGDLWVGSEYDGVALGRVGAWRVIGPGDGLTHGEVRAVLEDSAGRVWLATGDGITVLPAGLERPR